MIKTSRILFIISAGVLSCMAIYFYKTGNAIAATFPSDGGDADGVLGFYGILFILSVICFLQLAVELNHRKNKKS